jgi:hypothetical protein
VVRGGQVYYDDSYRSRGGVVRRGRAAYWRLARLERCSLALLVQEYLLTSTKVQILTLEALPLHVSKEFVVSERVSQTKDVVSWSFKRTDGYSGNFDFTPGIAVTKPTL